MRGLPWIRLDTDVKEHPKSDRLADALGEVRAWTYMVELWLWVANNQPDGNLTDVPDSGIARRAGYEGDARRFVKAITTAGFLGPDRVLCGWQERQAAIVAKFERDRKKPDGRKSLKSGPPPEIPRGIGEGYKRDGEGIHDAPAPLPHGDVDVDGNVDIKKELPVAPAPAPRLELVPEPPAKPPKTKAPRWTDPCPINPAGHRVIRETENRHTCQCGAWMNPGAELVLKAYEEAFVKPPGHIWTPGENVALANAKQRWSYAEIAGLMRKLAFDPFNRKLKLVALLQPDKLETVAGAMTGSTRVDNDALAFRGEVKL